VLGQAFGTVVPPGAPRLDAAATTCALVRDVLRTHRAPGPFPPISS